jgi:hypothetical protein
MVIPQVLINPQEHITITRDQREKFSVLDPTPARLRNRDDGMSNKRPPDLGMHALD